MSTRGPLGVLLSAALSLVGCGERAPTPPAATTTAPAATTTAPAATATPAATGDTTDRAEPGDTTKAARLAAQRARGFADQLDLPRPAALPPAFTAALPTAVETKAVGFVIERGLRDGRWAPGHHAVAINLLSPARGPAAEAALRATFTGQGWLTADAPLAPTLDHPQRGRLSWTVKDPAAWPTRVDVRLEGPAARAIGLDRQAVPHLLGEAPPWLGAAPEPDAAGYARRHVRRKGVLYTDTARVSLAWKRDDPPGHIAPIVDALRGAGWRVDDDDPRIWRRTGGHAVLLIADADQGVAYLHHDRRWSRPVASDAP